MSEKEKNQKRPLNQKEVEEMLERGDSFEGVEIGDVDFSDHTFENHVNFLGAKFIGTVNFYTATFLNGADFRAAEFSGDGGANFTGATFTGKGKANFEQARFTGDGAANFDSAKFSGDRGVSFYGAGFTGDGGAIFNDTEFSGNGGAYFTLATFWGKGNANFASANFSGTKGANFVLATFSGKGGAIFYESTFSGEGGVNFKSAVFSSTKGAKFTDAEFICEDRISFEDVTFEKDCIILFDSVKLKNPKNLFFRNAYLGNTLFFQTDVENINLKNVEFRKFPSEKLNWFKRLFSIRREGLMDEIREIYHLEDDLTDFDEDYYSQVEIIYRQFKRNFEEKRDYAKAGDFHYGEMEMRRKRQGKIIKYISLTAFYKYLSGYGQKWMMAFSWFIGFIILFTFLNLNWLQPIHETISNSKLQGDSKIEETYNSVTKFDSFLYTFNTMTLRKDARFEITDSVGSLIVVFQSAVGPTILALMLLAIRRQFRR